MLFLAFVLAAAASPAWPREAAQIETCSRVEPGGDASLCHAVLVPAPRAEVWRLLSTSEGLASWAAPVAAIDLRVGGIFESSYDTRARIGDAGNIRNRIVAFAPERLLAIQIAQAPPGFPHEELARQLTTAIELEPVDDELTRVRVTMMGYRGGEGFEALRRHFDRGNAWTLGKLHERIVSGPVSWMEEP
jgi:uncharacterized protein YndB with AHSA1/START domain